MANDFKYDVFVPTNRQQVGYDREARRRRDGVLIKLEIKGQKPLRPAKAGGVACSLAMLEKFRRVRKMLISELGKPCGRPGLSRLKKRREIPVCLRRVTILVWTKIAARCADELSDYLNVGVWDGRISTRRG